MEPDTLDAFMEAQYRRLEERSEFVPLDDV